MRRPEPPRYLRPLLPLGILLLILGLGGAVMLLWNYAVSPVLGVQALTYWQGVCIFVLCRILFGRRPRRPGHHPDDRRKMMMHLRRRMESMTDEERREFRERFRRRFGRPGEGPPMNH